MKRPEPEPLLLTQCAAARLLGVSRQTIGRAVAEGNIRVVQVYRRKLVPRGELDRLLRGGD